jgi:methylenetetrahydrofolate dehydrogenase (NADP+) / methenyltetrahydrofolate cyclohydrolase
LRNLDIVSPSAFYKIAFRRSRSNSAARGTSPGPAFDASRSQTATSSQRADPLTRATQIAQVTKFGTAKKAVSGLSLDYRLSPSCYDFRMTARILDGCKIRDEIFAEIRVQGVDLHLHQHIRPGLAAILVGDDPASRLYVNSKIAACHHLGLSSWLHTPPPTSTTDDLLKLVDELNRDYRVDGILIQLPLPKQVDTKRVLEAVDPAKDVDGFHPVNLGKLVSGRPGLVACTPAGCMEILQRNQISIAGANAVVLGRSDIVGKPMALLLLHANATVTICHSKTRDLPDVVKRADIVVAAMGKAGYVAADWIKPGAAVIDVGTNRVTDAAEAALLLQNFPERLEKFRAKGSVLVGDVHPDAVNVAGAITPVPGGVGPMTITMLMSNTIKAAKLRRGDSSLPPAPAQGEHSASASAAGASGPSGSTGASSASGAR